jgi:hypothetical protein
VNEYVLGFINPDGSYQELTFRGVVEEVASAMATGLLAGGFQNVTLTAKEVAVREINVL